MKYNQALIYYIIDFYIQFKRKHLAHKTFINMYKYVGGTTSHPNYKTTHNTYQVPF